MFGRHNANMEFQESCINWALSRYPLDTVNTVLTHASKQL